ncbi:Crp/Fnr family transcriptional regulator [Aliterella atlantica]|uniref:Crp/Fnr family transcriptional regulator n=1 Tax=Aliterella atlantica CENA595 TaxID=1618023 RepID=A0A0D8ZY80_9CYAN|nr:Crp/Fnr family transcriptional regulator [Aliterella atlantica]KJH73419.1 Crp/Fnr family transcriptional regulator [Aliterella atlantica CENA595]
MSQNFSNSVTNRLLASLPLEEYERLKPYLELVDLRLKLELYQPNVPIEFVYFPLVGVCSLLSLTSKGELIEVATIGNEGMVGLPVFLGANQIPGIAIVQVPGEALRMRAEDLQTQVTPGTVLYELLHRYTQALFNLIAQSALCNRVHSIEQRCCRWLLLTHDRVGGDEFPLTHEFLSQMLGVRRAGVSEVASRLQNAGFMSYRYGKIVILDRNGLEATSCECYETIKAEFERLIGGNNYGLK